MKSIIDKRLFLSTTQVLILERGSVKTVSMKPSIIYTGIIRQIIWNVLVARGATPNKFLKIQPDMDTIPAMYIKGTAEIQL